MSYLPGQSPGGLILPDLSLGGILRGLFLGSLSLVVLSFVGRPELLSSRVSRSRRR